MEPTPFDALFLKYDYSETIDLAKSFLTLISAVLVLSLTFSEKIVSRDISNVPARKLLFRAWGFLFSSVVFCGIGLCLLFFAAIKAAHGNQFDLFTPFLSYLLYANAGWAGIFLSGVLFVGGLYFMWQSVRRTRIGDT
jgi:hypothetical protein